MFWSKKPDPNPHGVRLGDLAAMLAATTIKPTLKDNALIAEHEQYTVRVDVLPPAVKETDVGPISAVVKLTVDLPKPVLALFKNDVPAAAAMCNGFAALGAVYQEGAALKIGSRLTIYEAEDAWQTLHLPLLLFTIILVAEPILGGLRRSFSQEGSKSEKTEWTEEDFAHVERALSRMCVCTTGDLGLTAEFALGEGAVSAAAGHRKTALWRLLGEQPHPEVGGGLFCLLQLPHKVADEKRLHKICNELNRMEMAAHDLPPHFGAWCPGRAINSPAYVSFLPNALHSVSGIASNASIWAAHRARWANAMMASFGFRS
jgi:hypothetical protein